MAKTLPSSSRVIRIVSCVPQDPAKTVLILASRTVSTARRCSEAEPASALAIPRCRSSLPHRGVVCSTVYLTCPGAWGSPHVPELGPERRIGEPPCCPDPCRRRLSIERCLRQSRVQPAPHIQEFIDGCTRRTRSGNVYRLCRSEGRTESDEHR